ncbi:MAG: flagellar assembly protein FliW [Desulfovibrio sp.]|nr:flagellar assembly protein FliW [Desulfovibrio sp.]
MEQENTTIEINTRLGRRSVDTSRIITFPRGLVGFEDEQRFVLLQIRPEAPLLVLQSVQSPQLGLLVTDPSCFVESYNPKITDADLALLGVESLADAGILVTVTIPQGAPEKATVNLTGPIFVNHVTCIGVQIPQNDIAGPSKVNLYATSASPSPTDGRAAQGDAKPDE